MFGEGLAIGVGIGVLFMIGLVWYLCARNLGGN